MYVDIVPNRNSPPAILLREGWRENGKVRKKTIANLSHWPLERVLALRRVLKDENLVRPDEAFAIERSLPHGHVAALQAMSRKIGLDRLIDTKASRNRKLVLAMILERLIRPASKLATTRLWHTTTLARELGVERADEDDLYRAMDWLLERQEPIEHRLARRHLKDGGPVFYDVTSSYYEGRTCSLMRFGYSRDGKRGKRQVVYGVLTGPGGVPVAVEAYPGNSADPATVPDQVEKLKHRFGLSRVVLVGDRGMLTETRIDDLRRHPELGWVSALRASAIRKLAEQKELQLSLFDKRSLAEITSQDFPGERLVACLNPLLADRRARKRDALLNASEAALEKIAREVDRRTKTPLTADQIGRKVERAIRRYKVSKHFQTEIADGSFSFRRDQDAIAAEADLDGIYVIRTSEPRDQLSADDTVRAYKGLTQVERLFRSLKGIEILIRPIHHREERRVRAHIFLCLLAGYLEWHLRRAWTPLLFDDEDLEQDRKTRDPVAPAQPSPGALRKKTKRKTTDDLPVNSMKTLIAELGTQCKNVCRMKIDPDAPPFELLTQPSEIQSRAFELIEAFPVTNTP